jgi:predicted kinase
MLSGAKDLFCHWRFIMLNLFLIRGISGSGKSTLTRKLGFRCFEADQFFMKYGVYNFDPKKLSEAHQWCQDQTRKSLENGASVVVANTFTQRWEMEPYIKMASDLNVRLTVIDLFDDGCNDETLAQRNDHGVTIETIKAMRSRYEHDWKNGNPVPPFGADRNF